MSGGPAEGALPMGTPVIIASWQARRFGRGSSSAFAGVVTATGETAPGLGSGVYRVRCEDGDEVWCVPRGVWSLEPARHAVPISVVRELGRA